MSSGGEVAGPLTFSQCCETILRDKMRYFIDNEVNRTTFAKPAYFTGDLELCKTVMHEIASKMNLDMETHSVATDINLRLQQFRIWQQEIAGHDIENMQSSSRYEMADPHQSSPIISAHEDNPQPIPGLPTPQTRGLNSSRLSLHTSTPSSHEKGECSNSFNRNSQYHTPNQITVTIPFFFTHAMWTALHSRLMEETKRWFAISNRKTFETWRRDSWMRQNYYRQEIDWNRAEDWKAKHACLRDNFLTRAALQPPQRLRVIDIDATCSRQGPRRCVVLIDWADADVQRVGYTAISHTYGMDVYEVFDCRCASECSGTVHPRCSEKPCLHGQNQDASSVAAAEKHKTVVNDILRMCDILRKAGINYAWHDGVCIAQHDEAEVNQTIQHMGWIYANAKETVIFLHYVGKPMAPIRNSSYRDELGCRWHTRAWTLQEGALSKCRRYCVRVLMSPLGDFSQSLEDFEEKIALWYRDDSSAIEIIEEERFFESLKELHSMLCSLFLNTEERIMSMPSDADDDAIAEADWMRTKVLGWLHCTRGLLFTLHFTCFQFPGIERALAECGSDRKSKHVGDYMNSILALAEVEGFVAPKKENLEASTIEFFKRQGQKGLALALFSINYRFDYKHTQYIEEKRRHTWPPVFGSKMAIGQVDDCHPTCHLQLEVLQDGKMEMIATEELLCVKVRFTTKFHENRLLEGGTYPGMYVSEHELARDDFPFLDMDLTVFDQMNVYKAKLSKSSCAKLTRPNHKPLGITSNFDVGDISMGTVYISVVERSSSCGSSIFAFAEELQEGDILEAHLVIPILMEQAGGILITQGNLDSAVSKVGIFTASDAFIELVSLIRHVRLAVTTMQKLIII